MPKYEIWEGEGERGMMCADAKSKQVAKLKKVLAFEAPDWTAAMQKFNDHFGLGEYKPPDDWA